MSTNKLSFKEEVVHTITCGLSLTGRWIKEFNLKKISNFGLRFFGRVIFLTSSCNISPAYVLVTKKQKNKLLGYNSVKNLYINVVKVYRDSANLIKADIRVVRYSKYAKKTFDIKSNKDKNKEIYEF